MKRLLVAGFLFCFTNASGQYTPATQDLVIRCMELLEKEDYRALIPLAGKAADAVKREAGETDPFYTSLFFILGLSHFRLCEYSLAEKNYLRQKELVAKIQGTQNLDYSASIARLAMLYTQLARYPEAIRLYEEAKEINRQLKGEGSAEYATMLNNLGILYQQFSAFGKAEQHFAYATEIHRMIAGEYTAAFASGLNNLASLYAEMGQYDKALLFSTRSLEIRKQVAGEQHSSYAEGLNNLASIREATGKFNEAERDYLAALAIFKKSPGENSPAYAIGLNNLAHFYQETGRYTEAEKLYNEALTIRKRLLGELHPDYATSLGNLAGLYSLAGQFDKAEQYYVRAAAIKKASLGEGHIEYAVSLNNLGSVYEYRGQFQLAESYYLQSAAIKKKLLGEQHPDYATSLNNLASFYQSVGQSEKARDLLTEAVGIVYKSMGENNPAYAKFLDNLSLLWQNNGEYTRAEEASLKAMEIRKSILGENNTDYAASLNNLASLYFETGQTEKAGPLIIRAMSIWKNTLGEFTPSYASALHNLAAIYRKSRSQYTRALSLYQDAIRIRGKLLGEEHPDYARTLNDLALLFLDGREYEKAESLLGAASRIMQGNTRNVFTILSDKEKTRYLDFNREITDCNHSYLFINPGAADSVLVNNYNLELGYKSMALADSRIKLEQVRNSKDSLVRGVYYRWLALKKSLARQYSSGMAGEITRAGEEEAEKLEKELNRRSVLFSVQQKNLQVTLPEVKQQLAENEAAVEFVKFRLYRNTRTDTVMYAAYIIRKNDKVPHFVPLCTASVLEELLARAGGSAGRLVKSLYRGAGTESRAEAQGPELYRLIWEPLEPFLKGMASVTYSPAGSLHNIAFHALPVDSTSILMDQYRLQQVTSTRQVAVRKQPGSGLASPGAALFGNPQFTMDSAQLTKRKTRPPSGFPGNTLSFLPRSRGTETGAWQDLPGTAEEVSRISTVFRQQGVPAVTFIREEASEENLKKLSSGNNGVLHLATHGFFLPETVRPNPNNRNVYGLAQDPLLRSGLVLAGGNYAWSGKAPLAGVEDGIVTAYEIAQLDFSQTELVVLSACETALGEIKGGEGVFGLQRAFKMAGVNKMIVSLWQVPDKETAELMTIFYTNWMEGKTIQDAFSSAQAALRKKYSPYYWAAFVLVE